MRIDVRVCTACLPYICSSINERGQRSSVPFLLYIPDSGQLSPIIINKPTSYPSQSTIPFKFRQIEREERGKAEGWLENLRRKIMGMLKSFTRCNGGRMYLLKACKRYKMTSALCSLEHKLSPFLVKEKKNGKGRMRRRDGYKGPLTR